MVIWIEVSGPYKKVPKGYPKQPSYIQVMGNIVKKQKDGPLTVAEDDGVFVTTNPNNPRRS